MQANPPAKKSDLIKKLPKRIAKMYGVNDGQDPEGGLDVHEKLDKLKADPTAGSAPRDADLKNRNLAALIRAAYVLAGKPNDDPTDPVKGPRFVLTWRMYPNDENTKVHEAGSCGCGCSCS
jgi:hypothetical protein